MNTPPHSTPVRPHERFQQQIAHESEVKSDSYRDLKKQSTLVRVLFSGFAFFDRIGRGCVKTQRCRYSVENQWMVRSVAPAMWETKPSVDLSAIRSV